MTITNTLKSAEDYRSAGFSEAQSSALAKADEENASAIVEAIKTVFAPEFARIQAQFARIDERFVQMETRIDERFALYEGKIEAKIESVARDQLFKIVALLLSTAAVTVGAVVLILNLSR